MTNAFRAARRTAFPLALLLFLGLSPAFAADEKARQAAAELMQLTNVEQTLGLVRDQIEQAMAAQIKTIEVPEKMKKLVTDYQTKVNALVSQEMSFASMKDEYIGAYVSIFTPAELQGLVAFYQTPVGKAFVEKQPQLSQKLITLAQKRMEKIAPDVRKLNDELVAQIKKEAEKEAKETEKQGKDAK